jgi:uncharacterized protein YbaP (TraB family)
MKKLFTFILGLTLLFTNLCFAQKDASTLWEISGNGLKQPSYLQGTMHMMCAKDFQLKQKTLDALAKVQKLVLELDYTNQAEMTSMQKMMQADKKLSEQLSANEKEELREVLKLYNTTLEKVDSYTIQALYSLIGQKAIPCPQTEVKMFEIELLTKAAKSGKTFGGLEKVADQIDALGDSYNIKETIRQLKAGDEYAILAQEMIKAFNEENLVILDKLLKDKRFMSKKQEDLMLNRRNINWVSNAMPAMMEKESVLFAVGSGHLWGEQGMIKLLQAKGYTVSPIN